MVDFGFDHQSNFDAPGAQGVGFQPGWVGGRPPGLTKFRYQGMLYRDMYATRDLQNYYRSPRAMGLMYFFLTLGIVAVFAFVGFIFVFSSWAAAGIMAGLILTGMYFVGLALGVWFLVMVWFRGYIRGCMIRTFQQGQDIRYFWKESSINLAGGYDKIYYEAFMDPMEQAQYIEWQRSQM